MSTIPPEKLQGYRNTAQKRWEKEQDDLKIRKEKAWKVVYEATCILKEQFSATKVIVFGSQIHNHWYSRTSDIDLAVWDLKGIDYFTAVARLQDISPEFKIDLIDADHCKPDFLNFIIREGKEI